MRRIDNAAIAAHAAIRFRSEYDYARFEYWRSAKVVAYLERVGGARFGRVLDDGCGSGGMAVSFAEESAEVVGIDPTERFRDAGIRLARECGVSNVRFVQADGRHLPFVDGTFDLVLSHAVIEHVADPLRYLREARRVLRPGGVFFLETAPYLSPSGAHLPRLKVPIPIHLLVGRRAAFALARWLARRHPAWLDAPPEGSAFIAAARRGETHVDDLLYPVTVARLRRDLTRAGLRILREDLYVSRLARRTLPRRLAERISRVPFVRDILITNMEYVLAARE